MAKAKPTIHYRRADTGVYATPKYAATHPKTTVRETDKPKAPKK